MQGQSLLPTLLGRAGAKREAVFSERNWHDNFDPIRSVRTARHKLILNAAPHFPYRPALDLEDSPSWQLMRRMARRGGLTDNQRSLFSPTRPMLELYDVVKDPNERNNVVDDPTYAAVRADLVKRLGQWMHQTYDFLPLVPMPL